MDVYTFLKEQHKESKQLLDALERTSRRTEKKRAELFAELQRLLEFHMFLEETMLYPLIKKAEKFSQVALEAYEEHEVVKRRLADLAKTPEDDEKWGAKLTVLKDNIEHHVEKEEGDLFKKAKSVLSEKEADELGAAMSTKKAQQEATQS
jgi:hemerythrin-like domain-containing protein